MSTININGKTFTGNNITVNNGKIIIDGKEVTDHGKDASITVEVHGNVEKLDCTSCTIHGDVTGDVDANTVNCKNIAGNVDANTVNCGDVGGDVEANVVNRR